MKKIFTAMAQALEQGQSVVLCSILASSGSTPRGAGSKMAVFADGSAVGTIGGGAVELLAAQQALDVHTTGQSQVKSFCLAPNQIADIGMICGGSVMVSFQLFDAAEPKNLQFLHAALELLWGNQDSWLVLQLADGCVREMGLYDGKNGLRFTGCMTPEQLRPMLGSSPVLRKGEPTVYVEPLTTAGVVYIFGGGHVGSELVPVLQHVGFRVTVFDNRPDFAKPEHYPQAERVILGDYFSVSAQVSIQPEDYVVIMTPGHQADREVLLQALRTQASYVGCIGSRQKIAKTNEYLLANGISEQAIARVHAPIGLPILGRTPEEIAVSIAAELILHRAQRVAERERVQ